MTPSRRLLLCIEEFRKLNPEMQMQTAMIFVLVWEAQDKGIAQRELANRLGIVKAAVSRNVSSLSDWDYKGRPGFGLVYSTVDPDDRKARQVHLTPKGKRLTNQLEYILDK